MPDRSALESLFLANLPAVERIAAAVARRHALAPEDAADFTSVVKLKLVEDDYGVLAKFRGESAITTYLTVVIAMLFRDYRVHHWGRWRPSAAALRVGSVAVRLETLVRRDGMRLEQAAELLRTSGQTTLSDRELARLLVQLPDRAPLRPVVVSDEGLDDAPDRAGADDLVRHDEAEASRRSAGAAIRAALAGLPPEDALIVRMHYWDGIGVADIARALQLAQKPLYRRLERLLTGLRSRLEAAGVSREQARAVIEEGGR